MDGVAWPVVIGPDAEPVGVGAGVDEESGCCGGDGADDSCVLGDRAKLPVAAAVLEVDPGDPEGLELCGERSDLGGVVAVAAFQVNREGHGQSGGESGGQGDREFPTGAGAVR